MVGNLGSLMKNLTAVTTRFCRNGLALSLLLATSVGVSAPELKAGDVVLDPEGLAGEVANVSPDGHIQLKDRDSGFETYQVRDVSALAPDPTGFPSKELHTDSQTYKITGIFSDRRIQVVGPSGLIFISAVETFQHLQEQAGLDAPGLIDKIVKTQIQNRAAAVVKNRVASSLSDVSTKAFQSASTKIAVLEAEGAASLLTLSALKFVAIKVPGFLLSMITNSTPLRGSLGDPYRSEEGLKKFFNLPEGEQLNVLKYDLVFRSWLFDIQAKYESKLSVAMSLKCQSDDADISFLSRERCSFRPCHVPKSGWGKANAEGHRPERQSVMVSRCGKPRCPSSHPAV